MSVARHHHYIPRFYLAGFTPSGQKDDHLSVLDLDQRKQWKSSTRDAGAARDFNRVDIPGMRIDAVEKALSPFESEVSSVLESLKTERNFTSEAELHLILEFVALLAVRNTLLRETMENVQEEIIWFVLQQMLASPERWKEQKESLRDQGFSSASRSESC